MRPVERLSRNRVLDTSKLTIESAMAGITATLAVTLLQLCAPLLGLPRLLLPELLGRVMQGYGPDWVFAQAAGWLAYVVLGTCLAVAYGWIVLRAQPRSNAGTGMLFALAPWAAVTAFVFPVVGFGVLGAHTGSAGLAIESVLGMIVYGSVMGSVLHALSSRTAIALIGSRHSFA
jgi:hypothetical protein